MKDTKNLNKGSGPAQRSDDPSWVVAYLRSHQDFFIEHPELLAELDIPHRDGAGAISLIERQVEVLRDKHRQEQEQLHALVQTARDNERLAERLHLIAVEALGFESFDDALDSLCPLIKDTFGVDQVSFRVTGGSQDRAELVDARLPVFADLYHRVAQGRSVCDNQLVPAARSFLFGDDSDVKSVVLVPLGGPRPCGIMALGSNEESRFTTEQGTFYLDRLGDLLGAAIRRLSRSL